MLYKSTKLGKREKDLILYLILTCVEFKYNTTLTADHVFLTVPQLKIINNIYIVMEQN